MSKLYLIILPIAAYAVYLAIAAIRGKMPSRRHLNMHTSLLLMFYLLATSGLGIFWVAHQQLPVFDWHYLFGYGTLLLVFIHLFFNLPPLIKFLQRRRSGPARGSGGRPNKKRKTVGVFVLILFSGLTFYLGMLFGSARVEMSWSQDTELSMGPVDAVIEYHMFSSESSADLFTRAPGIEWVTDLPEFKTYDAEPIVLPTPQAGGRPLLGPMGRLSSERTSLNLEVMSTILFHGAGVTESDEGYHLRAAPSSGALAPTEVYLHTEGFDGLDAGLYYYHPLKHHLVQIPTDLQVQETHVYITSVFPRTGQKYEDRAYRYAAADAGHILENVRLSAAEFGYAAQPRARFDENWIHRAIGLDEKEEGALADMVLTDRWQTLDSPDWVFLNPPDDTSLGVTGVVQHATSMTRKYRSGETLPKANTTDMGLFDAIRKRRSRRRFDPSPLSLGDLSALLESSRGPGNFLSRSVVLRIVVDRVDGLEPGVYRYLPESHALQPERMGSFMAEAYETTFSQDAVGEGAVAFVFSTDRRLLFVDHGSRGYRHAFLETGMQGERILLKAVALGLSACPVGAFFDDDAAQLVGTSMDEEWVIHFIGLGRPASD